MKDYNFIMTLLITGPKEPGNDINVYLQPMIDELKELWVEEMDTYDTSIGRTFRLHVALLWTINDFLAYTNMFGWSTKGKIACPTCNEETVSRWLNNSHKTCYMGHRRYLELNHPWRYDHEIHEGDKEHRTKPKELSGDDLLA